jgi:KDO2-lipid IV(A) lauroyltransferase
MPQVRRSTLIREVYQHLARVLLSLARMPRIRQDNIKQWVEYEGYEHYAEAHKQGRGVMFLTAHLGNWELSAHAHCLYGHRMNVVGRPLDNPYFDRYVEGRRTVSGNRVIRKQEFGRETLRTLRAGEAVGVLVDQNAAGDDGVFVNFFGHKASATSGLVRIAMRTGTPIIPGFAFWDERRGIYVLRFSAPLEMVSSGDKQGDLIENTQRCQNAIEQAIREYPGQWLWIHRRWKTQPPGEPGLY